jgi:hypothetical protein
MLFVPFVKPVTVEYRLEPVAANQHHLYIVYPNKFILHPELSLDTRHRHHK